MLNISTSKKKALLLGMLLTMEHLTVHAAKISPMTVVSETEEGVVLEFNITEIDPATSSGSSLVIKPQPGKTAEFNAAKIAAVVEKVKKADKVAEPQEKSSGFFLGAFSNPSSSAANFETWKVQVTANNTNVFDGKTVDVEFRTAKPVDKQPLFAKQAAAEIVVMPGKAAAAAAKAPAPALPPPAALPTPAVPTANQVNGAVTEPKRKEPTQQNDASERLSTSPVQVIPVEPLPASNTKVTLDNGGPKASPWVNTPPEDQKVYVSPTMKLPKVEAPAAVASSSKNSVAVKAPVTPAVEELTPISKSQGFTEKRLNELDQRLDRVEMQIGQIKELILRQQQTNSINRNLAPVAPAVPANSIEPPVEKELVISPTSQVSPFPGKIEPPLVPVAVLGNLAPPTAPSTDNIAQFNAAEPLPKAEVKQSEPSSTVSDLFKAITSATLVLIGAGFAFRAWERRKLSKQAQSHRDSMLPARTQSEMKRNKPMAPTEDLIDFMKEDNQMEVQIKDDGLIADSQNTVIIRREPVKPTPPKPSTSAEVKPPRVEPTLSSPEANTQEMDDRTVIIKVETKSKPSPVANAAPSNVSKFPQKETLATQTSGSNKTGGRTDRIEIAQNDEIDEVLDRLFANGKS